MTTIAIPLNKLNAWQGNVRRTDADKNLGELAASIAAHGLLQSLVVRKDKKDRYAVIAGRRRLLALKSLAEAGTIEASSTVPCHLIGAEANATEISLVENAVREQMHPADEFDAFLALIEGGMRPADIAARFGVTETVVQQRLKLARVSPVIVEAYRRGEITLAHVMAFAVSDDHAAQERVWEELTDWQLEDPETIREALTGDEVTANDRRVKFVTLKAYEKAGGILRRDLFSEGENGVFIQDIVLLESLVAKKLENTAARIRKQGWKWVETRSSFDHAEWAKCQRRYPEPVPLSPEEQAEFDALEIEHAALWDSGEAWDDLAAETRARLDEIQVKRDAFDEREEVFADGDIAIAGALVLIGHEAKPEIRYGFVKPEDAPPKVAATKTVTDEGGNVSEIEIEDKDLLSAALTESLTAHRSAAMAACLNKNPEVALAAVVHAMAIEVFYDGRGANSALRLSASRSWLRSAEGSQAFVEMEAAGQHWGDRLPGNPDALWTWCLAQDRDALLDLMAFCAARTVNAVQLKADRPVCRRLIQAGKLADALGLDMAQWFRPTAENYFGKISKADILAALGEIKGAVAPAWHKAKKSELALIAEREVGGSGWLPEVLIRRSEPPHGGSIAALHK